MHRTLVASIAAYAICAATGAAGDPYVPSSDEDVLAVVEQLRLPDTAAAVQARSPNRETEAERAASTARMYLDANSATGDPRHLGYSLKALEAWDGAAAPPLEIWLLRARLAQRLHRFERAQKDLAALVRDHPGHGEALLLLSTVAIVRADYAAARSACAGLAAARADVLALLCAANLAPYAGRADDALRSMAALLDADAIPSGEVRSWALTLAAELAVGLDDPAADRYYRAALQSSKQAEAPDPYLLGSYADYLTDRGDYDAALKVLERAPSTDATLIRQAVALPPLTPERAAVAHTLAERMAALAARGDETHGREQAWFHLHVMGDAATALRHAQQNWLQQREFRDARLLLEAAAAAGVPTAAAPVTEWLAENGIEHAWFDGLAAKMAAAE